MIATFICANIYGLLHVCQVKTTKITNKQVIYEVLLTDSKWYKVNACTAKKAKIGWPFKRRKNSMICI